MSPLPTELTVTNHLFGATTWQSTAEPTPWRLLALPVAVRTFSTPAAGLTNPAPFTACEPVLKRSSPPKVLTINESSSSTDSWTKVYLAPILTLAVPGKVTVIGPPELSWTKKTFPESKPDNDTLLEITTELSLWVACGLPFDVPLMFKAANLRSLRIKKTLLNIF